MRQLVISAAVLALTLAQPAPPEPVVRIGLTQNAATVTVRSARPFTVERRATRSATFTSVLALDPGVSGPISKAELQYRLTAELDDGSVVVMPAGTRARIEPPAAPLEIDTRAYRGALEVFGNSRRTLTVVNELPLEEYLRGVVPNELNPTTFGEIEALKAQAVAARTYIQRNLGQYRNEGYDVCATDTCQVYFGVLTEDALASQAVSDTRGVVATYDGKPINALYSSTCGGRTEDSENIFDKAEPYLRGVECSLEAHRSFEPFTIRTVRPSAKLREEGNLELVRLMSLLAVNGFQLSTAEMNDDWFNE